MEGMHEALLWHFPGFCGGTERSRISCVKPFRNKQAAQAALSFIILVSGIVVEIAIAGSFVTYFLSASGLGERLSNRALSAAEAGVRDAQVRITRDSDFVTSGSLVYSLSLGSDVASIDVSRSGSGPFVYTISSTGVASTRERKLVATLVVHSSGLMQLQEISEEPL